MNKRILYVTDTLGTGGAERQLALLVKYLSPEWERRVWSFGNGPFADAMRKSGVLVDVKERRKRYDILPIFDLWKLMIRWRPAIVHSWGWVSSIAVAPLCRILRIPWIDGSIRIGGTPVKPKGELSLGGAPGGLKGYPRLSVSLADRVITNSMAGLIACNIPQTKGVVIYNGFDPERLALIERIETSSGPFSAVMVGRMDHFKDFESFIQAARTVCENNGTDSWHFQALGKGHLRANLLERAADLIKMGMMDFPDAGLEVLPFVRRADVGVLMTRPPNQEGCSNAIMEYMACGLPVVCSDSGGNRELVVEGVTGFIIAPHDVNALVEKLRWLKTHLQEAQAMGSAGRQRFLNEYTVDKMVGRTTSIYTELLSQYKRN